MTDVHHCAALLGENRLLGLVKQFKPMKGDFKDADEIAYQTAIVQSFHAAEQILAWHGLRKQVAVEKHYLAAQLLGVPYWCLWYFARKEMSIIDTLETEQRIPREDAERAVLGCTTQQIIQALAKRWQLPDIIQDALDQSKLPSAKFLAQVAAWGYREKEPQIPNKDEQGNIVKSHAFIVALAYWLATEAGIDWYSRQTRRVLAVVAAYLEVSLHEARVVAQQAAVNVSRRFQFPGVVMPGERLLWPPQPNLRRKLSLQKLSEAVDGMSKGKSLQQVIDQAQDGEEITAVIKAGVSVQQNKPTPVLADITQGPKRLVGFASVEKEKIFKAHINTLRHHPDAFSGDHETMRKSIDIIYECMQVQRVLFLLFNPKQKYLQGYYARGCDQFPSMLKVKVGLAPANFFTQLLRNPQGVWVHPERKADIAALVPGVFKQVTQADEFVCISLFNHKGPLAVFYVDNGTDGIGLSETEFKIIKAIANATTKFMIQQGKRAKNGLK